MDSHGLPNPNQKLNMLKNLVPRLEMELAKKHFAYKLKNYQ